MILETRDIREDECIFQSFLSLIGILSLIDNFLILFISEV